MQSCFCRSGSGDLRAGSTGRAGLRNSVCLRSCTDRREIKFLGSVSARLLQLLFHYFLFLLIFVMAGDNVNVDGNGNGSGNGNGNVDGNGGNITNNASGSGSFTGYMSILVVDLFVFVILLHSELISNKNAFQIHTYIFVMFYLIFWIKIYRNMTKIPTSRATPNISLALKPNLHQERNPHPPCFIGLWRSLKALLHMIFSYTYPSPSAGYRR